MFTPRPFKPSTESDSKSRQGSARNVGTASPATQRLHAIQRFAGNRSLAALLRQQVARPIQRFQDGGVDVDISAIADPLKASDYMRREAELSISSAEMQQLRERFNTLIGKERDPSVIFDYLTRKATLQFDDDQVKELELQLEVLKYEKGLAMEMEEHNFDASLPEKRAALLDDIHKEGATVSGFEKRYNPKEKKRKFEKDEREAFTREGSVGLDLEGKYKGDTKEKSKRMKSSKDASDAYNKGVRTAAERLDTLYGQAHPFDANGGSKGTEMMRQSLAVYEHEGVVGIYGELGTKGPANFFEYDHQPQSDLIEAAASLNVSSGKKIKNIAKKHSIGGLTIVLKHERHASGATYGKPSKHKPEMLKIDSMSGTDVEKIKAAKALLKKATEEDAQEILDVYGDYGKNFTDIDALIPDADGAKEFKESIHERVKRGEARMKAQTFDEWFT